MDISLLLKLIGYAIYLSQALLAIWGTYNAVMVYRSLGKRSIDDTRAGQLLEQVGALVAKTGQTREAIDLCNRPPYWHTTLAQLVTVGLQNMAKGVAKIKLLLVMEFHTQIISTLENRLSSVVTAAKLAPLLGLLGTVIGMIRRLRQRGGRRPHQRPRQRAGRLHRGRSLDHRRRPDHRLPAHAAGQRPARPAPTAQGPHRTPVARLPRIPGSRRGPTPAQRPSRLDQAGLRLRSSCPAALILGIAKAFPSPTHPTDPAKPQDRPRPLIPCSCNARSALRWTAPST